MVTTSRSHKSLRVLFALLLGFAVIAMHQLGNANPAHASQMSMAETTHIHHSTHLAMAMPDLHSDGGSRGMEHPSNCNTDEHSCHGVAPQNFSLAVQPEVSSVALAAACRTCSKYAAARHEHDPPGRAELSVWRI
jgi:hypothetical protein